MTTALHLLLHNLRFFHLSSSRHLCAFAHLGSPVKYLASHYIEAKRCGLFFSFCFLFYHSCAFLSYLCTAGASRRHTIGSALDCRDVWHCLGSCPSGYPAHKPSCLSHALSHGTEHAEPGRYALLCIWQLYTSRASQL